MGTDDLEGLSKQVDCRPFIVSLAAMSPARATCRPSHGIQATLIDLDSVDWDVLEVHLTDAGWYSRFHSAIVFEEKGGLGCEFFETVDETWEAWEHLLLEASRRD